METIRILEMDKKKLVMLHYSDYGVQRSPNDQFDLLRESEYLKQFCDFVILNQKGLAHVKGHIRTIKDLYFDIKKAKPDIIHIVGVKEGFHCVIAALLAGCKKRILITRGFAGYSAEVSGIKKMIFRWIIEPFTILLSTHVHCNSYNSYNIPMVRYFARNKRRVVYNFLNLPAYNHVHLWRQEHKIDEEEFLICTIGNMHYGKGYDILQCIIDHYKDYNHVKFVVIGKGPVKEKFDEKNEDNPNVYSLGALPHDKTIQVLSECNLFYLPTRFESLGMVYAEAGACGIPSIGTNVGAVSEIISDGNTGFLVNIEDSKTAIEKIDLLISDKTLCQKLGQHACVKVKEQFSTDTVSRQIMELYNL